MAASSRVESDESPVGSTTTSSIQLSADDGRLFPATVYTGIDATKDPELRQALLEGRLNEVESPFDEQRNYHPAVPVIYHHRDLELFALVIPERLRHEEFRFRRRLLSRIEERRGIVPDYMRQFDVVFAPSQLEELEEQRAATMEAADGDESPHQLHRQLQDRQEEVELLERRVEELESERDIEQQQQDQQLQKLRSERDKLQSELDDAMSQIDEYKSELQRLRDNGPDGDDIEALEERQAELKERADELDRREEQLEEVADRVERDSLRVDEAREEVEGERAELEHRRQKLEEKERRLQVRELNLEQRELQAPQQDEESQDDGDSQGTQVVTDDQFVEVVDAGGDDSEPSPAPGPEPSSRQPEVERPQTGAGLAELSAANRPEPTGFTIVDWEPGPDYEVAALGDSGLLSRLVETTDDLVVAGFRISDERALRFADGEPEFLFQCHDVDGVPIITLTLALFDDEQNCVDAIAAPLESGDDHNSAVMEQLQRDLHVHLVVYGEDGQALAGWEAGAPIRSNIEWARSRLDAWSDDGGDDDTRRAVAESLIDADTELVGSMRHPFDTQSFVNFDGASDVALAVSIVGYWSEDEQLDYLIGNRSFPLESFHQIQQRVVRQALHWGIAIGPALRNVAIDQSIIVDDTSLVQRLLSNFAEVCVGLRRNDLDPIEQWENWADLIELAEARNVTPDPEVIELAEASLERAEEYEEVVDEEGGHQQLDAVGGDVDVEEVS